MSGGLPEGWTVTPLPEIAEIVMGQSPPGKTYNSDRVGLPFFQGKADFGPRFPVPRIWCSEPKKIARAGDVLVSVRAPVGPTNVADRECAIGRGLAAIRPLDGVCTEWLLFALRLRERELAAQGTGSTFTAISRDNLRELELAVPPLAEQRRIVAKVEALLARVNATRERLAKSPAILKRFRQSALAAACSGRLTEDWRASRARNGDSESLGDRGELPGGWAHVAGGELYVDACYGTSVKCDREARGVPVVRVPNIAAGRLDLSDLKYAALSARELESLSLAVGDLVVCRTNGSLDLVGKAAVIPVLQRPHAFASYLIRLRVDRDRLLPGFLHVVLMSRIGRDHIEERARTTAGQFNLNLEILRSLRLPLPPVTEQQVILRRIENLFKIADIVEGRVSTAASCAEKLTQAILAKAFRGELVPTEAELARLEGRDYEPASVLLEKLVRGRRFRLDE